jgi:hypothetical protein
MAAEMLAGAKVPWPLGVRMRACSPPQVELGGSVAVKIAAAIQESDVRIRLTG